MAMPDERPFLPSTFRSPKPNRASSYENLSLQFMVHRRCPDACLDFLESVMEIFDSSDSIGCNQLFSEKIHSSGDRGFADPRPAPIPV
jgi:hypothetical protein